MRGHCSRPDIFRQSCGWPWLKGLYSYSRWNVESAGSSREWRPEGAPTTDETLPILLSRETPSVVVVSVVFCPVQKKICHWFTECITRFFSICVRYPTQYLQGEKMESSFRLEMMSQFLGKQRYIDSSLAREWCLCWIGCTLDTRVGLLLVRSESVMKIPISMNYSQYGSFARSETIIEKWSWRLNSC